MIYRFGSFELDTAVHQLRLGAAPLHVQPRVFDVLHYLVVHSERAVSREELLANAWSDMKVADGSLTRAIRGIRSALAHDASLADAIETVRGYGYRFAVEVQRDEPAANSRFDLAAVDSPKRPFVGRQALRAEFARIAAACRAGSRQVASIVGEPGTGKTALARAALAESAPDFLVGEGRCLATFGAQTPYLPLREAVVNLVAAAGEDADNLVRQALERAAPSWRSQLPTVFDEATAPRHPSELQETQMAQEMLEALELIARKRPTALFIEDLHWADESTLALIASLARRSVSAKLLLVCTTRTNEIAQLDALINLRGDLARIDGATELATVALSLRDVQDYVCEIPWAAQLPGREHLAAWLHERSEGHPLFLERLVEHLASLDWPEGRNSDESHGEAEAVRTRLEAAGVPATLGQLLRQWSTGLASVDRKLLETASVAGHRFDIRSVASAARLSDAQAEESCDRLCTRGWLVFEGSESWPDGTHGATLSFGHALFAEALYGEVAPGLRARLHCAIADRMAQGHVGDAAAARAIASQIASHYERGGARQQAAPQHVAAALHAASQAAVAEALHHAESGLAELAHMPAAERDAVEADLRMAIGFSLANRGGFADDRIKESFERACELTREAGDAAREVAASWGLVASLQMRGEIEAARAEAERLLELAEGAGQARYLQYAWGILTAIAYFQGRFADCVSHAQATLAAKGADADDIVLFNGMQDIEVTIGVYAVLAHWHLGDDAAAHALAEHTIARARALDHPFTLGLAEAFTAIFYFRAGNVERQREHAACGIRISEAADLPLWAEVSRFMEICSDPPAAEQLPALRTTLQRMAQSGGLGGTFFLSLLAERELAAGQGDNARNLCQVGFALAERTTERNNLPALYLLAAGAAQDPSEARALLDEGAGWAERLGSAVYAKRIAEALRREVARPPGA